MGKWTYNYTEQVLHSKISSLVTGAINRAAIEKEPSITFDDFVHALDPGDSFTASLIDILVKELAERATRPENERRLIADRTAKSLRLLATPLRIYRERPSTRNYTSRRAASMAEYLSVPPNEMELEEDEDEFDTIYDVGSWPITTRRILSTSPSPPLPEPAGSTTRIPASSSRSGPWSMPIDNTDPIPPSNVLVRQPSIRRPPRSRTVDFNDFTHRRRSTIRDTLHSAGAESVTEPRDTNWLRASQPTRRFFPFSRMRRHESSNSGWEVIEAPGVNSADNTPLLTSDGETTDGARTRAASLPSSSTASQTNEERSGPRLRRGGLRAPESMSMLSRHASPVIFIPVDTPATSSSNPMPLSIDGPTSYPTPESTENDNFS